MTTHPPQWSRESMLLVGLGSLRGDDAVGLCIASQLAESQVLRVTVRLATSPAQLFDWLDGVSHLIICDACVCSAPVGHLYRWTWPTDQLEHLKFSGTHDMSLPVVLALADRLGQLPPNVTIWGVTITSDQAALPGKASPPTLTSLAPSNTAIASELHKLLCNDLSAAMDRMVATIHAAIATE